MNAPVKNAQNAAADPRASSFLTANAGSGKTSTLVNRVARLLLNGAHPEHILCVTYTKAAAAEMQGRLFEQLGRWAILPDDRLREELHRIDEGERDLARARALFARALETPGGLKIQTIHAFCEKLLRRFPLEAGLSPAFGVLDDLVGQELAEEASADLLTRVGPESLVEARTRLIRKLKVSGFEALLSQFIMQHDDIATAFEDFQRKNGGDWQHALFRSLDLDGVCTSQSCLEDYAQKLEWQVIADLAAALGAGTSKTNRDAAAALAQVYQTWRNEERLDIEALKPVFLTQKGDIRKTIYTKETSASDGMMLDRLAGEIVALIEQIKAAEIASNTMDALLLFSMFSAIYQSRKAREGALDFQDLINKAKGLLSGGMAPWVLFKLDGGLEHILVDEAQDTSEDQWRIVEALSDDFFSGLGQTATARTVFAVGDEKQSIYGFQGADPREFLNARHRIGGRAVAANASFVEPDLIESWRSLPEILSFVDAAFDAPDLAEALTFTADTIRHVARRSDAVGLVELWPRVLPIEVPEVTADDEEVPALDASRDPPAKRLAQQLAATVRDEILLGRSVYDKGQKRWRAMHAGDVLVLVRKRDALFEHIIRELKIAGVAVSGADRLKLEDHIAFQDLRALMRFCLQEKDDLSLACILRSPLCDLSEDDLFVLSHGREGSLWTALGKHPDAGGRFAEAREFLAWTQNTASQLTAFDFLSRVLNRRDRAGRSMKQRFLTRLGDECEDVLEETLGLALKGEGVGDIGLSHCLNLFEFHASQIKREQEEGGEAVRVMTVHGSKGLEAPWVILPIGPNNKSARNDDLLLIDDGNGLYLAPGRKGDTRRIADIRADKALDEDRESLRLFYVALTRARDRLTLCGWCGKRAAAQGNFPDWYALAQGAFARLPEDKVSVETMRLLKTAPFDDGELSETVEIRLYGERSLAMTAEARLRPPETPLPDFVTAMVAQGDADTERWQAISQLGDEDREAEERAPSPLQAQTGLGRYRRGNLIHKLFEMLPELAPERRDDAAARYLGRQVDLNDEQRHEIAQAVMAVLTDARFAEAFGPQSRPEVALAGQIGMSAQGQAVMLSGRIDRLVVTAERVLIIDYKSNRPAPDRAEDAPVLYQRQMAGYVALLRQIYPDKRVEAALLWTDGPRLTPLSEPLVNLRLGEVLAR